MTCLTEEEIINYLGNREKFGGYGWHITEPKLFDKPRELSEFGTYKTEWVALYGSDDPVFHPLKRPSQSWCYIDENDIYD